MIHFNMPYNQSVCLPKRAAGSSGHEGDGLWGEDVPSPLGSESEEGALPSPEGIFFDFSSKNAGFCAFFKEKLLVARKWDWRGA